MKTLNWKKLTKAQRRVAIAKDVIAQVRSGHFVSTRGAYCNLKGVPHTADSAQLQSVIPKIRRCEVCARGAFFLSGVFKFNDVLVEDSDLNNRRWFNGTRSSIGYDSFDKTERRDWGTMAYKIEDYFEDEWSEKYPDSTDRLIAICKNIIKNNGTFKP